MANFAQIDRNGRVIQVIVINDAEAETETDGINFLNSLYGSTFEWVQTYDDGRRYNYAGIGYLWDSQNEAFIAPKPSNDFIINPSTYIWEVPDCSSITHDDGILTGDGIDFEPVTIRGKKDTEVSIAIKAGDEDETFETIVLDEETENSFVGSAVLDITCDTPGINIVLTCGNSSTSLVVIYA